jgi:MerR family transcriptional regulator, light-induced transcriptional regulator
MVELNESKFGLTIQNLIDQNGFENTFINIVYPFLSKIGILWQTGNINPAQEHFASNLIKRKLFATLDALPVNQSSEHKFIVFLPEGEFHEIGLLFYTYILKKSGYYPVYLGQSVPLEDLIAIQQSYDAEFIFTSLTTSLHDTSVSAFLLKLSKTFKKQKIFIAGEQSVRVEIKRTANITKIKSPDHFKDVLKRLKLK